MPEAFPLAWPDGWPRTSSWQRERARFKVTRDQAMKEGEPRRWKGDLMSGSCSE